MDTSRRDFLRLFTYGALAAIAPIEALCNVREGKIRSDVFHFSANVPKPWRVLPPSEYIAALERNILRDGARHQLDEVPVPIVSVTLHPEPMDDFNPGLVVQADRIQDWMGGDLGALHDYFHQCYLDYNVNATEEEAPHRIEFRGIEAISSCITYDQETTESASCRVRCRAISLFYRESLFLLAFGSEVDCLDPQQDPFIVLAPQIEFE